MKRAVIAILLLAAVLTLGAVGTDVKKWSEINRATGATRTRTTYALVFSNPWTENPTWVSERAEKLGMSTDSEWMALDHSHRNLFTTTQGSARAPAAFLLRHTDESVLSEAQQDVFIRTFAGASEGERDGMIRQLIDGSYPSP